MKILYGEEIIKKILEGERDFREIRLGRVKSATEKGNYEYLPFNFNEHDGFEELQAYLRNEDKLGNLRKHPLLLEKADFNEVEAVELHLPYTRAAGVNFQLANFAFANFSGSIFTNANLKRIHLDGADLRKTDFSGARMYRLEQSGPIGGPSFVEADLRGARFDKADLEKADFSGADLRGAIGLQKIVLDTSVRGPRPRFKETIVTRKEKAILEKIWCSDTFRVKK